MDGERHDIIVIGTSAGGFPAANQLLAQLPKDLQATIFLVIHLSDENSGQGIVNYFKREVSLECKMGEQGEKFEYSKVYIAPPNHHMLIKEEAITLSKGARENKYRPSIDHTFRSAAAHYGARVIGIVLTGMMEDGTSGMASVRRGGGICLVQDPQEAVFSDMPLSVLSNMKVDYSMPIDKLAILLRQLVNQPAIQQFHIPEDLVREAQVAERVSLGTEQMEGMGEISAVVCPECGGALWKHEEAGLLRFKCHTGHSFTDVSLLRYKSDEIEESMWVALRMLEEKRHLLKLMQEKGRLSGQYNEGAFAERIREAEVHASRLREVLLSTKDFSLFNAHANLSKNGSS